MHSIGSLSEGASASSLTLSFAFVGLVSPSASAPKVAAAPAAAPATSSTIVPPSERDRRGRAERTGDGADRAAEQAAEEADLLERHLERLGRHRVAHDVQRRPRPL